MKTTRPRALVLAATAILAGCTSMRGSDSDRDRRIEASARRTYVYRTHLTDDHIRVEAEGGIVTLTGTVGEESHKTLAQDTVEGLPGVKKVENRLKVLETPGDEAVVNSDSWIGTKVKTSLWFHRSVSSRTQVDVKHGVVTLNGIASSQAQKDLTAEYATDVEGVKGVDNEMTVAQDGPAEERNAHFIDDASITAQVRLALASRRSTSALRTKTETLEGVVTLSGKAANQAEKDLVTKLTRDIDGVKSVNNNMTVKA